MSTNHEQQVLWATALNEQVQMKRSASSTSLPDESPVSIDAMLHPMVPHETEQGAEGWLVATGNDFELMVEHMPEISLAPALLEKGGSQKSRAARVAEIQEEHFAEDVSLPSDALSWSDEKLHAFFESGGDAQQENGMPRTGRPASRGKRATPQAVLAHVEDQIMRASLPVTAEHNIFAYWEKSKLAPALLEKGGSQKSRAARVAEIQEEHFAEDVSLPSDALSWSDEKLHAFFESGGVAQQENGMPRTGRPASRGKRATPQAVLAHVEDQIMRASLTVTAEHNIFTYWEKSNDPVGCF